ncbi:MAG: flavodoxin [Clostridiales bacterium]|nr:flavodoxin [Clostridiales bacterium]
MKALVIYQSKTGFTKQYAQWIGEELGGEAVEAKQLNSIDLKEYDTLIYGGCCHAGMISGLKNFLGKAMQLNKKVAVFAVGASPAENPEIEEALRRNFTDQQREKLQAFYFPGGLRYEKMGFFDKTLMAMFRVMTKKTEGEDSEMYRMLCQSYDLSDKKYIEPLVLYCREEA